MKSGILLLLIAAVSTVNASVPQYCQQSEPKSTRRMSIPGRPNYFFRAFPEAEVIGYATDNGNHILDMTSGKTYGLPGIYDPVPVGEHVISVPSSSIGMAFYSVTDIVLGNNNPPALATSTTLLGVYQSVGLIAKKGNVETYGMIVAGDANPLFQKVRVTVGPEVKVEPLGEAMQICLGVDLKLPMLSKDASEVSGRDMTQDGVTKIWKIDHKTGRCTEVENLGIEAGKADFSFDGRYLAFHLQANGSGDLGFFRTPEQDMSMNTYIYDRKTKFLSKISYGRPGDNAYYPVFRKDGSLVYAILDQHGRAWFAHVNPQNIKKKEIRMDGKGMEKEIPRLLALGRVWNKKCANAHELKTAESLLGAAITLTPQMCHSMVKENWTQSDIDDIGKANVKDSANGKIKFLKDEIQKLTVQDLEEACSSLTVTE